VSDRLLRRAALLLLLSGALAAGADPGDDEDFGDPEYVRGRQAIAQYWREVPSDQAEISFRFGEVFVAGPWFATEFRCTYRRLKTGDWIEVSGAMFCEAAAEKISEMRMYWERVVRRR